MTTPNDPAFPNKDQQGDGPKGLTKREYFAAMAMQGILSGDIPKSLAMGGGKAEDFANHMCLMAKAIADALIAELNK